MASLTRFDGRGLVGSTLWRQASQTQQHELSTQEVEAVVAAALAPEHVNLQLSQIGPRLADQGVYLANESSFYRILRARG